MVIDLKSLHYAHSDGHTDICYSENGDQLISCGGDGDVRFWNGFDDDDPLQTCLGEFVLCVQQKNEHVLVATDNDNVQLLSFPSGERDSILARFSAHVNHIAVSNKHNWVAIASEDMSVKVMELTDKTTKIFSDLKGTPLSVAICSQAKVVAVSCGDGSLKIYNIEDETITKEFIVVPKTNNILNAKLLCRTDFDQIHNKYFAYPDKNQIVIINQKDWSEAYTLKPENADYVFSIVKFSPCCNYIAGASLEGVLAIWSLQTQTLIGFLKHPKNVRITSITWNPKGNGELAFADEQGYVGLVVNCTNIQKFTDSNVNADVEFDEKYDDFGEEDGVDFGDVQIDDDDGDNENAISLEKLKKEIMGSEKGENEDDKSSMRSVSPRPRSRTPDIPLQEPFMPSSTPEHLDPRYMCWNEVGIVRCYGSSLEADNEGTKSIEVEFHDSTFHSSMMMNNFQNYTMGSISTGALAVANKSTINVIPLASSSKEWHLNLDEEEEIVCIATSQNLVCFATRNNSLHVCSIFGIQKTVISIPGPILCMSAFGHVLLVAYHSGAIRNGDQCIEMMLIKMEGTSVENRDIKCVLKPGSKLQWLGFSDMGTPALMDTNGMLYLHPLQSNIWLPFCDTTKLSNNPLDSFFVTAVYEAYGTIRGIKCKSTVYPGFTPRPNVMEIDLQPPFIEMNTEKSQLESNLFTMATLQVENSDRKYKETALKIFALSTKNNLDERAYEFIEMLQNPQILTLAMKYASKLEKRRLAEKLTELASKLGEEDDDNDVTISTPSVVLKPSRNIVLNSARKSATKSKTVLTPSFSKTAETSLANDSQESTPTSSKSSVTINTQDLLLLENQPKNPFLKSLKKQKATSYNPLSLTDKFAGIEEKSLTEKENKNASNGAEKRKNPEEISPVNKNKEKQRKLNQFMFSKRT